MTIEILDRRLQPRIEINGDMSYRVDHSDQIRAGLLENLSEGGARIWIEEELPAASQVVFKMESDSSDAADMTFRATLLHKLPQQKSSRFGYGCVIEIAMEEWVA